MKLLRGLILVATLFTSPVFAQQQPAIDFHKDLAKATLALYERHPHTDADDFMFETSTGKKVKKINSDPFVSSFTCTATVVDRPEEFTYILLTAGHCFDDNPVSKYYVSEGISSDPTLQSVKILKKANTKKYDYAILELHSPHEYPVIKMNLGELPAIETPVVNINYSFGLTQQLVKGFIGTSIMKEGETEGDRPGRFIVEIGVGPGASGSAIVDDNSQEIIGLAEAVIPGFSIGTVVMPLGKSFDNFMIDDAVNEKAPPVVDKSAPKVDVETGPSLTRVVIFLLLVAALFVSVLRLIYQLLKKSWKTQLRK